MIKEFDFGFLKALSLLMRKKHETVEREASLKLQVDAYCTRHECSRNKIAALLKHTKTVEGMICKENLSIATSIQFQHNLHIQLSDQSNLVLLRSFFADGIGKSERVHTHAMPGYTFQWGRTM